MTGERDGTALIDPGTGEQYRNVPPAAAARFLGIGLNALYYMLQSGTIPIGSAAKTPKGTWVYAIPCERLIAWATARDLNY